MSWCANIEMENKYGVGITNRYSCFIDNEDLDPLEQLKLAEHEKEIKKKGKTSSTTAAEKENRGKETTSSGSSVPQEKETPPAPPSVAQQKSIPWNFNYLPRSCLGFLLFFIFFFFTILCFFQR